MLRRHEISREINEKEKKNKNAFKEIDLYERPLLHILSF